MEEPPQLSSAAPEEPGYPTDWSLRMALITALIWTAATVPWAGLLWATVRGTVRPWLLRTIGFCSLICATGFEIWFTYGLLDGQPVTERRPEPLNRSMPLHINWLLNSLSDGTICMIGVLIIYLASKEAGLREWRWKAALPCLAWFVAQNLVVEMVIYSVQLAEGVRISWAPLSPAGPYWNPTLFRIGGASCSFQAQVPWLVMWPVFYSVLLWMYR